MFSTNSWVHNNALISSTVKKFEPFQIIPGCLSHSRMREKIGENLFPREDSLFLKNLVLDLLGPKEMIESLAHYLSEKHVCPYDVFHDICHIRYYDRKYATFFFLEIIALSSKTFVSNSLLGVTEMVLWLPQYLLVYVLDPYKKSRDACHAR